MWEIEIRHNFETAHRLNAPGSPVKCMSIHGHSWWVTATLCGERLGPADLLVEFGAFKKAWRGWLDASVDHHLVLQREDPMADAVLGVFPESRLWLLDRSPTTEVIAQEIHRETTRILAELVPVEVAWLRKVHVQETRVNAASYGTSQRPSG